MDCPFSADRLREVYWSENKTAADIAAMVNVWAEEDGEQPVTPETVEAWLTERDISLKSARDLAPIPAWDVLQARLVGRRSISLRRGRSRAPREPRPPRNPDALRVDAIDLTGQKFGALTVQAFSHRRNRVLMWRCLCDCGQERLVEGHHLRYGHAMSCGCRAHVTQEMVGRRFGRLVVTGFAGRDRHRSRLYSCLCDCGRLTRRTADALKNGGDTTSCGCLTRAGVRHLAGWTLADLRRMRADGLSLNQIADAVAEHNGGDRPERSAVSRWLGGSRRVTPRPVWRKAARPETLAPKKARPLG